MVCTLFFWLPFKKTYVTTDQTNTVVSTGMYALCRHPGAIWVCLFYLFLWLASGKLMMLWAGAIWTLINILYIYVQDRWIFPHILTGYNLYQQEVPFLIPNNKSIKICLTTFR
jgi:protein-S-isoprenylcysteine O-methyltransferase Ste14